MLLAKQANQTKRHWIIYIYKAIGLSTADIYSHIHTLVLVWKIYLYMMMRHQVRDYGFYIYILILGALQVL